MMTFERYITCIDSHTGGEPTRIVTSGFPPIPGDTILEKREYVLNHYDHIRKMLMFEPRGHAGMYGCIIVPPVTPDGDIGVLFTHNEGLSTMCGHATIGVTTVVFETGMMNAKEGENTLRIDSPAGRITSYAYVENGRVKNVRFANVPSFVLKEDITVNVDGVGPVVCDVAFCGAFYVYVDADKIGVELTTENVETLVKKGMELKYKVMDAMEIVHPLEPGLNGIYGTIIMDLVERKGKLLKSKNICIFAEGQIDRSPTGTGTGGRVALLHRKGIMKDDDQLENLSIIDTSMTGKILEHTQVAGIPALVPEVSGRAFITGFNQLVLDPEDPIPSGFRLIGG
ncbi:MAG: proline racemase family protein [Bacillota bacterium]|jgi:proline racemase